MSEQERQTEEILSYYSTQKDRAEQSVIVQMLQELKEVNAVLTEELKRVLDQSYAVIEELALSEKPPHLVQCKYCKKCAYGDYCWS